MLCTTAGYDVREPVEVRILKDRIEISSYPGLERSIPVSAIHDNNIRGKKYRNRRIGDFLKELKLTEGRNTGIPKIKRALKNNGSPDPIFETDEDRTYFITTILIHEGFRNIITGDKTGDKIISYLQEHEYITTTIAKSLLGLETSRTREI